MVSEQGNENGEETQEKPEGLSANSLSSNESSCTTENSEDNAFGTDLRSLHPSGSKNEISPNNISTSITETSENGDSQTQDVIFESAESSKTSQNQNANSSSQSLPSREILDTSQTSSQFVLQPHASLGRRQKFVLPEANLNSPEEPSKDYTWNINSGSSSSNVFQESQGNNLETTGDYDSLDGAVSLPLNSSAVPRMRDDVVTVDCKKPFKLPSLVNLFEAAEAQRVELEENARALSDFSLETRSSNSSDGCNSDTESQQASNKRVRSTKV